MRVSKTSNGIIFYFDLLESFSADEPAILDFFIIMVAFY